MYYIYLIFIIYISSNDYNLKQYNNIFPDLILASFDCEEPTKAEKEAFHITQQPSQLQQPLHKYHNRAAPFLTGSAILTLNYASNNHHNIHPNGFSTSPAETPATSKPGIYIDDNEMVFKRASSFHVFFLRLICIYLNRYI